MTVTAYGLPDASPVAIVNCVALALIEVASPPLFNSARPFAVNPLMVPPTVYVFVEQVMAAWVTGAVPIVPDPVLTEQVCPEG